MPGDSEGQESLACCSPQDLKELGMTRQLNNNEENRAHPVTLHLIPYVFNTHNTTSPVHNNQDMEAI